MTDVFKLFQANDQNVSSKKKSLGALVGFKFFKNRSSHSRTH